MDYERYSLYSNKDQVEQYFALNTGRSDLFQPVYNATPGTTLPIIRMSKTGEKKVEGMPWGISVPGQTDKSEKLITVSTEQFQQHEQLAHQLRSKRCIIPANGFFQWKVLTAERKLPFYIRLLNEELFGFAGLFSEPEEEEGYGFALLTTEANALIQPLHTRMPAVLNPEQHNAWLDPDQQDEETLLDMLQPYPSEQMSAYRVSNQIDDPSANHKELIKPAG